MKSGSLHPGGFENQHTHQSKRSQNAYSISSTPSITERSWAEKRGSGAAVLTLTLVVLGTSCVAPGWSLCFVALSVPGVWSVSSGNSHGDLGTPRGTVQGRQWQPTPVFLPGGSQGRGSLVGCHLRGRTESDTTEVT